MISIHDRAREIVHQSHGESTLSEAYSKLAQRRRRGSKYGRTRVSNADRHVFANVESPRRFAWMDRADFA